MRGAAAGSHPIFSSGTGSVDQLRAAAYDLRIGHDFLITPSGARYWPDAPEGRQALTAPFTINPGEVAFVSSAEELAMPDDLAANIAIRFRTASAGIFVMGGLLVDPGYKGRLHFQLANIGTDPFIVVPGKTSVAALQFLPVVGRVAPPTESRDSSDFLDRFFYVGAEEPLPSAVFFAKASSAAELTKELEVEVKATSKSTEQLVVFGVFLVSATLFTVAVAALVDALAAGAVEKAGKDVVAQTEFSLAGVAGAATVMLGVGIVICLMMQPVREVMIRSSKGKRAETAEEGGSGG
jgi:deoxycytidine triphosphate deaminase